MIAVELAVFQVDAARATRCAMLIPRTGKRVRMVARHPELPVDVVKFMLNAI